MGGIRKSKYSHKKWTNIIFHLISQDKNNLKFMKKKIYFRNKLLKSDSDLSGVKTAGRSRLLIYYPRHYN